MPSKCEIISCDNLGLGKATATGSGSVIKIVHLRPPLHGYDAEVSGAPRLIDTGLIIMAAESAQEFIPVK